MKPLPDKRLGHITAEYQSPAGLIKSAWRYEGEQWVWEFTIPEGTTASVTLPGESEAVEYAAGSYTLTKALYHIRLSLINMPVNLGTPNLLANISHLHIKI